MRLSWFRPSRVPMHAVASLAPPALLILACVFAPAGTASAQRAAPGDESGRDAAGLFPRTIAVIPFANISGRPDDDWMGTGIAETVTADLERLGELAVVRREALLDALNHDGFDPARLLNDDTHTRDLARALGVSWVVSGGFQRLGDQLRITARIVDVETGLARATVKVDGPLDDIFTLQDRIVAELGSSLGGVAGRETPPPPSAPPPAAAAPPTCAAGDAPVAAPAAVASGGITFGDGAPERASDLIFGNAGVLAGRETVRPTPTQTPPEIDGRLDDAVWRNAARITEFVQRQPLDGAPATEATDVFVAYDSANIYLAFHAKYDDPGIMRANRVDRDRAGFGDDNISVYFDTFLDQQRAYVFSVNGYGVQGDAIVGGRGGGGGGIPRGDRSWDALYSSGGQLVEDGFTAEMAIPFKSLRYPSRSRDVPHTWGFQIVREIRGKNETVVWSPVSRDIAGFLPQMGVMDGMAGLSTSRNLEIQPAFTAFRFGNLDEELGQVVDGDPEPDVGANFKYGVTSNLTADFTLNPDFSQIESDRPQVEVNQRFALFFPELRPFFLEGAEIFQVQAPVNVVHTRTIVDPLYGAKLTGKASDTTIGVLYANDKAASLGIDDPQDPAFGKSSQTFVGRVRYDLYSESFVGAVFTDREFLGGSSRVVGVDSNFRIGNTHQFGLRALRSDHRDADDGLRTDGHVWDVGFRKSGRNLSYSVDGSAISPDFKTDVGFVRRRDQRTYSARAEYEWWPQDWLISWGPEVRYGRNYDFSQTLQDENLRVGLSGNFDKNIRANASVNQDLERYQGINFDKRRYNVFTNINTSQLISFGGGFNWGDEVYFDSANPFLGRESGFRTFINFRPASRLATNINITTSRFTDPGGFFVPALNGGERTSAGQIFDVKIFRALTTYQFTDRLLLRNITQVNSFDQDLGVNFLVTYRVNSGTVFYIGYDDHYQQREQFDEQVNITGSGYQQTNRAIFMKFQYLFRY